MKRTVEELIKAFSDIVGERTDEAVVGFMEDISDSFNTETPTDEYREKYEDLLEKHEDLLERYRKRFYSKEERETETVEKPDEMKETVEEKETTYDDILKEE